VGQDFAVDRRSKRKPWRRRVIRRRVAARKSARGPPGVVARTHATGTRVPVRRTVYAFRGWYPREHVPFARRGRLRIVRRILFGRAKNRAADRGMKAQIIGKFAVLTIILTITLAAMAAAGFRSVISANWDAYRCDPGVAAMAGTFKPDNDRRTAAEFATDNWRDCQKDYIQNALRIAAKAPAELADAQAAVVGVAEETVGGLTKVFQDLWAFCYEAYSMFMDRMKGVAKLFHNFLIKLHELVGRAHAAATSIAFALIGVITTFINSVITMLIVVAIVVGIILAMSILLFFIFPELLAIALGLVALIAVGFAAIAAEGFAPGVCFRPGTRVATSPTTSQPIESLRVGDILGDGGVVTAVHRFWSRDTVYDVSGIFVTGDHLIINPEHPSRLVPVRHLPPAQAVPVPRTWDSWLRGGQELWCLTTSSRRIPVIAPAATAVFMFADWEEIPADNTEALRDWHAEVWEMLNGGRQGVAVDRPLAAVLRSDPALGANTQIPVLGWGGARIWKRVADVEIGDRVITSSASNDQTTLVVGKVQMSAASAPVVMELQSAGHGPQFITAATWLWQGTGVWAPAMGALSRLPIVTDSARLPTTWWHLYTESGTFTLSGGWRVRDASDVGLDRLRDIVEEVVLTPSA
jgi:hypothetical protein